MSRFIGMKIPKASPTPVDETPPEPVVPEVPEAALTPPDKKKKEEKV